VRTLDSMYGTGIPPDEAPTVEQVVDGEDYSVDVHLAPAAATLLEALAHAFAADPVLREEWLTLTWGHTEGKDREDVALRRILADRAVRQALTIRLTPGTADHLHAALDQAALPPQQCRDGFDHGDPCRNYAAPGETACPHHLPADDGDRQ
jgi:hypothetical protein